MLTLIEDVPADAIAMFRPFFPSEIRLFRLAGLAVAKNRIPCGKKASA